MKSPFGVRLWLLITAIVAVGGGIIFGLSIAWGRLVELEKKLTSSQLETFRLAGVVEVGLARLNDSVLRYAVLRNAGKWDEFVEGSTRLDHWIDEHDPSLNAHSPLTTEAERHLFQELNRAYDEYRNAAHAVHTNQQPAIATPVQLAQLEAFDAQARRMQKLAGQLAEAHHVAESEFLADANESMSHLRSTLVAGVVMLLALVAALGLAIYRDTIAPLRTKLVQSQTLLEKQEKLATLGTLAAGIAHEIRNPLTSLKARLYTLEKHLQAVPAARKDTGIINAEISRLERIVQDVLSFARPSEPVLERTSVETLLREVHGLMASSLEARGVHLAMESAPEFFIQADAAHLKQVLINLIRNGAEAIDGAGTVTLRAHARRAALGGHETSAVLLEVSDTGRGIPPEIEQRLFDPFFSTKETGTGLGLSIAARIVEKHGGALQYQTRLGHGTTFGIVLPAAPGPDGAPAPAAVQATA